MWKRWNYFSLNRPRGKYYGMKDDSCDASSLKPFSLKQKQALITRGETRGEFTIVDSKCALTPRNVLDFAESFAQWYFKHHYLSLRLRESKLFYSIRRQKNSFVFVNLDKRFFEFYNHLMVFDISPLSESNCLEYQ